MLQTSKGDTVMENTNIGIEKTRRYIAGLIMEVLNGTITPEEAIEQCGRIYLGDKSATQAVHALYHYRDDADLRARDVEYGERQTRALAAMAQTLAEGLPLTKHHGYWL